MSYLRPAGWSAAALLFLPPAMAAAQDSSRIAVRCETFCSQETLRTVSARLVWSEPAPPPGAPVPPAAAPTAPQVDVTVVKNGFDQNAFASFPTIEPGARATGGPAAPASGRSRPRAYDLRITGSVPPPLSAPSAAPSGPRETSLLIENLEPGLRYSWRLRFDTAAGVQVTVPATCVAPVCPADLKE